MAGFSLFTTKTNDPILIRPATFADLDAMARTATAAYDGTPLNKFISPLRAKYPADTLRSYYQRLSLRWLSPRNLSFVACAASSPETAVVGYTQLQRLGDDDEAKRQIASRRTVWLTLQSWFCRVKFRLVNYVWPDRSRDAEALRKFQEWAGMDDDVHWNSFPERANRWHLQGMVVSREWQGKGIGKRLLGEVLDRASKEGVLVGVEASEEGEILYRRVGFELLSRFTGASDLGMEEVGGIMIWKPEKVKDP